MASEELLIEIVCPVCDNALMEDFGQENLIHHKNLPWYNQEFYGKCGNCGAIIKFKKKDKSWK